MRHSRGDSMLLAGVGTLAVHEIAYLPGSIWSATGATGVSHSHVPVLWGLGGAVAVAALLRFIVASLRSRGGARTIDPRWLGGAIAALYVSQEAAERALSGSPAVSLVTEWVLWSGLAAVPVVALLLARLVDGIVELAASAAARGAALRRRTPMLRPVVHALPGHDRVQLAHVLVRRGPPIRTVTPT